MKLTFLLTQQLGRKILAVVLGLALVMPSTVAVAGVGAEMVSLTPALTLKSGQAGEFEARIRNNTNMEWRSTGDKAVKVATVDPQDRTSKLYESSWLSSNRVTTATDKVVEPGEVATFKIPVVAGIAEGAIVEKFGLVMEGVQWFDLEFTLTVNVLPTRWDGAWAAGQPTTISLELKAGEVSEVALKVRNNGETNWVPTSGARVALGTTGPFDRKSAFRHSSWLSDNRVAATTEVVEPSESGEIKIALSAPAAIGTYREEFGLVAEGVAWLAPRLVVEMKVVPAIYSAQWLGQSASVSVARGDSEELWVEFKNTGNVTWRAEGPAPVRLGTDRAIDRESQFKDSSWISSNRVVAMEPKVVAPNEVAKFTFKIQAPDKVGTYREYFRPVVETVTWLNDVGLYWDIAVDEEVKISDNIRVGLTSTTKPITVQGNSFTVRKASDESIVKKVSGQVVVTPISGGYKLSSGETVKGGLRIVPLNDTVLQVDTEGISSSYNKFRGVLVIERSTLGNVWVVNHLGLEDYMKGIAEVPDGWPKEAQKAQMVAARTFAAKKRTESVSSDIFDVYDDTRHQVYYGYKYEVPRQSLVAAAEATRGQVIKHQGQLITSYYFSDSWGSTEASYNVWGKGNSSLSIPYLQAVRDPYSRASEWRYTLTQSYLKSRFDTTLRIASANDNISSIQVTDRFSSGHVKTVRFVMENGRVVDVPSWDFDYLTNNNDIRSMAFDVVATGGSSPDFLFTGKGWGHGVGMAQWGARNMAEQGFSFKDILTHYYTGVSVTSL